METEKFNVDKWLEQAPQPIRAQFYKVMAMGEDINHATKRIAHVNEELSDAEATRDQLTQLHDKEIQSLLKMLSDGAAQ